MHNSREQRRDVRSAWLCAAVYVAFHAGLAYGAPPITPGEARALVTRGTALMNAGDVSEAAALFDRAANAAGGFPEAVFNAACARAAMGAWEEAEELFAQVDRESDDERLRSRARYNLGHAAFRRGLEAAEEQPAQALEQFRSAASLFHSVYLANRADKDAARNTELARMAIQRLKDRLEHEQAAREQERQRRQEAQQQAADALRDLAQRQQSLAERAQDQASREQLDPEALDQLRREQETLREDTREALDSLEAMQEKDSSPRDRVSEAIQEQSDAERNLDAREAVEASRRQNRAAELLREAAESMAEQAQRQEGDGQGRPREGTEDEGADSEQTQQQIGDGMSEQERRLRELLERERREREMRRDRLMRGRVQPAPVERDW